MLLRQRENQKHSFLSIQLPGDRTKSFLVDGISPSHAVIKFFNQVPNHKQLTEYDINQLINELIYLLLAKVINMGSLSHFNLFMLYSC